MREVDEIDSGTVSRLLRKWLS